MIVGTGVGVMKIGVSVGTGVKSGVEVGPLGVAVVPGGVGVATPGVVLGAGVGLELPSGGGGVAVGAPFGVAVTGGIGTPGVTVVPGPMGVGVGAGVVPGSGPVTVFSLVQESAAARRAIATTEKGTRDPRTALIIARDAPVARFVPGRGLS